MYTGVVTIGGWILSAADKKCKAAAGGYDGEIF